MVDNLIDPTIAALGLLLVAILTAPAARRAAEPGRWRLVAPAALPVCGLLLTADAQVFSERSLTTKNVWDAQKAANLDPALDLYDLPIERLAWRIPALALSRDFAIAGYARDWR